MALCEMCEENEGTFKLPKVKGGLVCSKCSEILCKMAELSFSTKWEIYTILTKDVDFRDNVTPSRGVEEVRIETSYVCIINQVKVIRRRRLK